MSDIEEYATEYPFDTGYQWIEQIKAENAALRERVAELEKEVAALEAENIEYIKALDAWGVWRDNSGKWVHGG